MQNQRSGRKLAQTGSKTMMSNQPPIKFAAKGALSVAIGMSFMMETGLAFAMQVPSTDVINPVPSKVDPATSENSSENPFEPQAPEAAENSDKGTASNPENIEFSANNLDYDFETDIVVASGDVKLEREGYSLFADKVVWNRKTGQVTANGNVRSIGPDGEIAYGDNIQLSDSLRDGVVENLLLVLEDGGRLVARKGQRNADGTAFLENAAYTACTVVNENGCPKNPSWQIKAVKVRYNPIKKRVSYDGARIEIFGLPLIPLPGLSHPTGDENRSGILVPDVRFSSSNGAEFSIPYYFSLAPNRDLTLRAHVFTDVLPMISGTYRSLEQNGAFQISAYATSSTLIPVGETSALNTANNQFRGYLETNGRFRLGEHWSLSQSARIVTDRTFLRRYDISRDDRLRSSINLERIDSNSYFSLAGWAFQTLRVNDPQNQVPVALPSIDYRRRLKAPILGGVTKLQVNSLAIGRAEGQNTQRAFAAAQWDLKKLTKLGQVITVTGLLRGDVYNSNDNLLNPIIPNRGDSGFQARAIASAAVDVQWPFIGKAFGGTQTVTPRVQFVLTPGLSNQSIPNEDSRAVDLEDTNLFALNRFPGYDRFEDNIRVTYGLDWELNRPNWRIKANIGQSYRLANNNNIVPDGTGLSERVSDVVGRTEVRFKDFVKFTHRYRLDKDNLAIRRNEIDATVGSKSTFGQIGYLRLNRNIDPALEDLSDREELRLGGRVQIDRYWSVFGSAIIDLTDADEVPTSNTDGFETVRQRLGVAYDDGCLSLGFTWRRDFEDTGDATRGSTFLFRIALRHLGF